MRARVLTVAAVVVAAVSLAAVTWVMTRPDFTVPAGVTGGSPQWSALIAPIAWTVTGAVLLWLRPHNAVGALVLFVGVCQAVAQGASAYGMYGVGIADPHWPAANAVQLAGRG
jgi:hypothetical protein